MRAIWSEQAKIDKWLEVELAVVEALCQSGVVPPQDAEIIKKRASATVEEVAERESVTRHDVAAFVDVVASHCGPAGRWIHFGLTSSDVLDTALALRLRDASRLIREEAAAYFESLKRRALEHKDTPCVGRTHGIHAEPTTFGAKLASFAFEALRFIDRLDNAVRTISVGKIAGAVGSYSTLSPDIEESVCRKLGLRHEPAPTQIVARDRLAEYMSVLALGAAALERFALEIRHLQRTEVAEVEEPFSEGQKGSSAMPHKKNPVSSERICGLARLVRSLQIAALENIALLHERDISHSSVERAVLPLGTATLHFMLGEAASIARDMKVNRDRMRSNLDLTRGAIFSQRLLLALIEAGIERDAAYRLVQKAALKAQHADAYLSSTVLEDEEITGVLDESDIEAAFNLDAALSNVSVVLERLERATVPEPRW